MDALVKLTSHPLHTTNVLQWGPVNEGYCCSEVHSCPSRLWLRPCLSAFFYLDLGLPCSCRLDEPAVVAISLEQKNFIVSVPVKDQDSVFPKTNLGNGGFHSRSKSEMLIKQEARSYRAAYRLLYKWLIDETSHWFCWATPAMIFKI